MSVLFEAREIVRTQPPSLPVAHLRSCADELHEAYDLLKVSLTREAAARFTAAVTRALLAIDQVKGSEPPAPQGGALKKPKAEPEEEYQCGWVA
jgi:hypothetical protein